MAYDLLDLKWDNATNTLSGRSKLTQGDLYELRIHVPDGYEPVHTEAEGLEVETRRERPVLRARLLAPTSREVTWRLVFSRDGQ